MPADAFLDTTVLIYAVKGDDARSEIAEGLLAAGGTVSVQALNEFAAVARRKLQMNWSEIQQALAAIRTLCGAPVPITVEIHESGLRIARRHGFHIYDSLMIAAAQASGCTTLYSEDMQHGQKIGAVRVRNPFLA